MHTVMHTVICPCLTFRVDPGTIDASGEEEDSFDDMGPSKYVIKGSAKDRQG